MAYFKEVEMLLHEERQNIVEYGRRLLSANLTTAFGGNLSIFNRREQLVAIKPSGVDYNKMRPRDVVITTPGGEVVDGRLKPSSELRFHLALYQVRQDVNAVVHTHQVHATTVACLQRELPPMHYLIAFSGDKVPLAPYATFGSQELSNNIIHAIGQYNACLMANHGLVTVGSTIDQAFTVAEMIELVAQVYIQARSIGQPALLSSGQVHETVEKFRTYGQH